MKYRLTVLLLLLLFWTGGRPLLSSPKPVPGNTVPNPKLLAETGKSIMEKFGKLPMRFEANRGQSDPEVRFLSRGSGYALFLTSNEAVLSLKKPGNRSRDREETAIKQHFEDKLGLLASSHGSQWSSAPPVKSMDKTPEPGATLRLKLLGANPAAKVRGMERLPGESNYFIGNDPARWQRSVPSYAKVRFEQVYPGIDVVYYGNPSQLEYDFVLAPKAKPSVIRMDVRGADKLDLDNHGDLVLSVAGRQIRQQAPAIYQEEGGTRHNIAGHYIVLSKHQVGFQVAAYDSSRPLTIDPVLVYSSYLGGSGDENSPALSNTYGAYGAGIAVDGSGNVYLTGYTTSLDFPAVNPSQASFKGNSAVYAVKIDPTGSSLVYSTFLGGNGDQDGLGIALDTSGNAYVAGFTTATNFPTTPGAFRTAPYQGSTDAFVTKINAAGSTLGYSTYLGGNDLDIAYGVAVDSGGNAYIAGVTGSTNFPTVNGFQRTQHAQYTGFVSKFNASGSALSYSTYLGGSVEDIPAGIAVDSAGNAYVAGSTVSKDFPTTSGAFSRRCGSDGNCNPNSTAGFYFDNFVTKLNATGSGLVYSTFLGGGSQDNASGIAVDSSGNAYVTGTTYSTDFPTTSGALQSTFGSSVNAKCYVTKLNDAGSALVYSTFLGGTGGDSAYSIAVDSSGNAYVTGTTVSTDFPTAGQPFQPIYGGLTDGFVAKLNSSGSALSYSSYLGGSQPDIPIAIAVDGTGNSYVTGVTGSSDFPTINPEQPALSGTSDAFVAKIRDSASGGPTLPPNSAVNGASFSPTAPLSPGSIATVFGSGLAPSTPGGTVLAMNGIAAPLYFVGRGQINFQVPWELAAQSQATLLVNTDKIPSNPLVVTLGAFGPGIFAFARTDGSTDQGAVLISNTDVVAAPAGSIAGRTSRPANRGEFITIYCTGLGPVSNQPATGVAASANPLSFTATMPVVTVLGSPSPGVFGDVPAAVSFSGLTPGFFGLYQVDAQIPQNAQSGVIPLKVVINGVTSNTVSIAVQ